MAEIFEIASRISSMWSLAAFAIAALLFFLMRRKGKVPRIAWFVISAIVLLALVPISSSVFLESQQAQSVYRLRITVLGPDGQPVNNAQVVSSVGGEPKQVAGGWEYNIPRSVVPSDGRVTLFASLPDESASSSADLVLGEELNPTLVITLEPAAAGETTRVLPVNVSSPRGRPIPSVVLATREEGAAGPPTSETGRTDIPLAAATKPFDWVTLQIVETAEDLVFISPWDSRALVPKEGPVSVILSPRSDRLDLESTEVITALTARINAASAPTEDGHTRSEALALVARDVGVPAREIDRAIRALPSRTNDPYSRGMAALYAEDYNSAVTLLEEAVNQRRDDRESVGVVHANVFLGDALAKQGQTRKAVSAWGDADFVRPNDKETVSRVEAVAKDRPEILRSTRFEGTMTGRQP